jgi:hypothetical protein
LRRQQQNPVQRNLGKLLAMVNRGPENVHRGAAAACNCQALHTDIVLAPSAPHHFHN